MKSAHIEDFSLDLDRNREMKDKLSILFRIYGIRDKGGIPGREGISGRYKVMNNHAWRFLC